MAVRTIDAARRICERGNWQVSNLKLQKILYMAHMIHMGRGHGRLVPSAFEAWDYGPVATDLYNRVKMFGAKPVEDIFFGARTIDGSVEASSIDEACDHLMQMTPGQLVAVTHWQGGAWARHYSPGAMGVQIPDADIMDEYRARSAS